MVAAGVTMPPDINPASRRSPALPIVPGMEDVIQESPGPEPAHRPRHAAFRALRSAWRCAPASGPTQRRARLLTALLATLIGLALVALVTVLVVDPAGNPRRVEYGVLIGAVLPVLVGGLALNRVGRYRQAAVLTVACAVVVPWASALLDPRVHHGDFVPLTFVVVPILLSGILLSGGVTAIVSAGELAGLLIFASIASDAAPINWPSLCILVLFVSLVSIVASLMNTKDLEQITRQNRELEESEAWLREQSVRDHVSGLFNRRYLEETLERELHRAARSGTSLGIVMVDLDRFKDLNDRYGHAAGDEVLRRLGELLKTSLRFADIACRYGGDEFILILPEAPRDVVQERAEQLRRDAGTLEVEFMGKRLPSPTISLGVSVFPEDGTSGAALLAASDLALYRAKTAGRDCVGTAEACLR
jgi:diguanylate cyclase (GGDEF)-like protein